MLTKTWKRALVTCALGVVAGCSAETAQPTPAEEAAEPMTARDLASWRVASERQPFEAFRKSGLEWSATTDGLSARVDAFGEMTFQAKAFAPPAPSRQALRHRAARPDATETSEVRLNTMSIRRGGVEVAAGRVSVERGEGGALLVQRGSAREVFTTKEVGVEQSWEFDQKPDGTGELVVEVSLAGAAYVETTAAGIRLRDANGLDVVYGHGVWIDRDGLRHEVPSHFNGSSIELRVPAAVLESSGYPAVLDPILGSPASTASYVPRVASSGSLHASVWESYASTPNPRIQFSFINDADGTMHTTIFNKFVSSATYQAEPMIAFDGTEFVVVWRDKRSGVNNIRVARISTTGAVSGEAVVATSTSHQYSPALSCVSPTSCLVTWNERMGTDVHPKIRASTYNPATGARGVAFVVSTLPANDEYASTIGHDGSGYFVAWESYGAVSADVLGRTVATTGAMGDVVGIATTDSDEYSPALGYDGSSFVVGFTQWGDDEDAMLQRVSGPATVGSLVTLASGAGHQGYPQFARSSSKFMVSYDDCDDVKAAQIDGTTVGASFLVAADGVVENLPSLSAGSTNFYVTYNRRVESEWRGYGTRLSSTANLGPASELTQGPPRCDTLSTTTSPFGTQVTPGSVVISASSVCSTGTAEYEFYVNTGMWTRLQAYGPSNSVTWNTAGYGAGTYPMQVRVRRAGNTAAYDAIQAFNYVLTGTTGTCNAISTSTSLPSPQAAGATVSVTGSATCTNGATPHYKFLARGPNGYWTLLRDWSASATFDWSTAGAATGTHQFQVQTRSSTSVASLESAKSFDFEITGGSATCTAMTVSTSPAAAQPIGTPVLISASATCTSANPEYLFYTLAPGGYWSLLQNYSTASSATWTAAGQPAGTHTLQVRARHAGGTSYDVLSSTTYVRN